MPWRNDGEAEECGPDDPSTPALMLETRSANVFWMDVTCVSRCLIRLKRVSQHIHVVSPRWSLTHLPHLPSCLCLLSASPSHILALLRGNACRVVLPLPRTASSFFDNDSTQERSREYQYMSWTDYSTTTHTCSCNREELMERCQRLLVALIFKLVTTTASATH